jgi:quercetin dioxygenase-like cupin family protein
MRFANFPVGAIDWSKMPTVVQAGEYGTAAIRTCNLGDITLRIVTYDPGFRADHWCPKGHIVYVISGSLVIEYEDKTRTALCAGMSWHAPDDANPPHRALCEAGATIFIVD